MRVPPENIVVRGVNWLGDAVMSTPALMRLREARPAARVTILAPEKLAPLWRGQSFVDDVLSIAPRWGLWSVAREVRRRRFTAGLLFPNSLRSALELWLGGVPERVGVCARGRRLFLTRPLPHRPGAAGMRKRSPEEVRRRVAEGVPPDTFPSSAHHVRHYLYLTQALGAAPDPLPPRIELSAEEVAACRLKFGLTEGRRWLGLNPGAEYGPAKRWPVERFAAAAATARQKLDCTPVIFGGPGDVDLAAHLARAAGEPLFNLAGKTTLRELACALKCCEVVLTNDSGPMHLAAAVGARVAAIFGSTAPELTGPPNADILRQPPPCAPCFLRECPIDLRCLRSIDVERVVAALTK